jgi:hypothetical protein
MNRIICLLISFLALIFPSKLRAGFDYLTNAGETSITITGYSGPTDALIPSTINGLPVTDIGEAAFGLKNITSVVIPSTVTNIDQNAFDGCGDLTNVVFPNSLISVGYGAFSFCGFTSLTIPTTLINVGVAAFADCENLTNLTVDFGVSIIGSNMFEACDALRSVTIPASITNIEDYAFLQCESLTNIFFCGNAPAVGTQAFADYENVGQATVLYSIATAYYLPGTTGWAQFTSNTFIPADPPYSTNAEFVPAVLWNPAIQTSATNFGIHGGQYGFDVTGTSNLPIAIEARDDLTQSNWVVLRRLSLTNGLFHFSEPFQSNAAARLYRIGFP